VLKRKCFIPQDSDFYKRLLAFRSERDEKTKRSINNTQLFLPRRIVHLVDIKGDNGASGYAPYYARRREFNQLVVSKRMIADHDIHYLVDILENTRLCGDFNAISCVFGSSPYLIDEDVPEVDIRLFICCSNPYGKMTHGFDDKGRKFDYEGNMVDWWSEEDGKEYEKRVGVMVDQASKFEVHGQTVKGALTSGENIADLGGLRLSMRALVNSKGYNPNSRIDGFTPIQRFFLSWAQCWRQNLYCVVR
jgi:hypothetical protein